MLDIEIFVQNVKNYCNRKEIKPTVACRESGAGERLLENIKRGSIPSVEKVQLLAQYLGVTVNDLLGDVVPLRDSAVRLDSSDTQRLTVSEVELILAYRRADERTRAMVQLALEPFAEKEKTATISAG